MAGEKRNSIRPTYDSRETGPRYHVTTRIGGRVIEFQHRVPDPFIRQSVTVGWPDLLRGLLRRCLLVEVLVGGDPEVVEDVLDLDGNYLGSDCARRDAWNSHVNESLGRLADGGDVPA